MERPIIKSIIVDDENPSRQALAAFIKDFCPDVEVLDICDSVKTAYQSILKNRPHLVFLDIEMPNGNGFDLLMMFKILSFKVIFVTAYSEYAIRAFRFAAIDYLLKPVKIDELIEAVERVRREMNNESDNLKLLIGNLRNNDGEPDKLVIRDSRGFVVVKLKELIMCEADGYCTHFYLTGNRKITGGKNLGYFEELLGSKQMIKVHRSYLINQSFIVGFTRQGEILMEEKLTCPLGDNYRNDFLKKMEN